MDRVSASVGLLNGVETKFEASCDVKNGGVLFALPALLVSGLLHNAKKYFQLPKGYYGLESIFILLSFLALCRIKNLESLRYSAPGEWGKLLGLDRIPEVKTLRAKIEIIAKSKDVESWSSELCKHWMAEMPESSSILYIDGHTRVYHGSQTKLPRHYVSREKLCLRATSDYWVNAMDGCPFFYTNKAVDPGMIKVIEEDIVPRLEKEVVNQPAEKKLQINPYLHRFSLVFDREGYSPDFFLRMRKKQIACITYHKFPSEDWPVEEFREKEVKLSSGHIVKMNLAERGSFLSKKIWLREIRKLSANGHQTTILSTDYCADLSKIAAMMFARWSQENFFKYMREHFSLDRLIDHKVEHIDETTQVVNPKYRKLDGEIRSIQSKLSRKLAQFGSMNLEIGLEKEKIEKFELKKSELLEQILQMQEELVKLKDLRKEIDRHIKIGDLSEEDKFKRLSTSSKHFVDTIKMIAYRAENAISEILKENMARPDESKVFARSIFNSDADIIPDEEKKELLIRLHHIANPVATQTIQKLCDELNDTEIRFPGTELQIRYEMVSN